MSDVPRWWTEGPARRPPLSDKLADWNALPLITGEEFIRGRDVLELGPEFGLDAIMLAHLARRWTIVDNAQDVLEWMARLKMSKLIPDGAEVVSSDFKKLPFENEFDLVIDFGSIDNSGNNLIAYEQAVRSLRRHGFLITTYANRAVLHEMISDDGSEERILPDTLASFLTAIGMWVRNRHREQQPRALMIAQKGGEPTEDCTWWKTNTCTCRGRS